MRCLIHSVYKDQVESQRDDPKNPRHMFLWDSIRTVIRNLSKSNAKRMRNSFPLTYKQYVKAHTLAI